MMRTGRAAVGCGICMFLVIMMPAVGGATLWHYTAIGSQLSGGQWGIPTYWGSVIIDDQLRDFGTGRPTTPDVLSEGNSRDLEFLVPQYSLKVGDTSFSGQTEIYINGIWPSGYAAPISLDVEFSAFGGLSATFYNADGSPYPRS